MRNVIRENEMPGKTGIRFFTPVLFFPAGVMLASLLIVFPGLFDSTMTSRLALYPLAGVLLLFAGRRSIPLNHLFAFVILAAVPAVSLIWTRIPVQGITSIVRWTSFGMMIAGFGGIASNKDNIRILMLSLVVTACIASILSLVLSNDMPVGNPNRLGPLLAVSIVAVVSGITGIKGLLRIAVCALISVALLNTAFYIGMIATVIGSGWFLINRKFHRLHPGWLILAMVVGQIFFSISPRLIGLTQGTLELRLNIWRTAAEISADEFPLGTGAGQARIRVYSEGPPILRSLAGEDKRVDFLHSDLLTLPVELGFPGLVILGLLAWWIVSSKFSASRGALIVVIWPFITADLPLATPIGALPVALVLAISLSDRARKIKLHWIIPAVLGLLSLFWAQTAIRGYSCLESGRRKAILGDAASSSGSLEKACELIPFEERGFLMLAQSQFDSGRMLMALESIDRFNYIYPSYWKGWFIEANIHAAIGRTDEAAAAFLHAVITSPEKLALRPDLALNALAVIPDNRDHRLLLANVIINGKNTDFMMPPVEDVIIEWTFRISELSKSLIESDPDVSELLWIDICKHLQHNISIITGRHLPHIQILTREANHVCESFDLHSSEDILERMDGFVRIVSDRQE